jgi:uncharacterized YccA/Bax inhibitor family protein
MRTGNPALSDDIFRIESPSHAAGHVGSTTMTLSGTIAKTGILLALTVGAAAVSWVQIAQHEEQFKLFLFGGLIGGLVLGLATSFKPNWSPVTAPLYALCEGLLLGAISLYADAYARNITGKETMIVPQAIGLTLGTLAALLLAYTSGLIKATENFKLGVAAATGAICLVYLASWVLRFFDVSIPYIHEGGLIGIGFSLFVVVIAALNLVLDFDFIETGVQQAAPKYMEWYGGFALLVTLVWLYIEFLKLLMKLQKRD